MLKSDTSKVCVIFSESAYVNDMCDMILTDRNDPMDIVFVVNIKTHKGHVRTKLNELNLGKWLQAVGVGGGHPKAAAFSNEQITKNPLLDKKIKTDILLVDIQNYIDRLEIEYPIIKR